MKNFEYKKYLGQNFLIDQNIMTELINCIDLKDNALIIEIGAGSGSLTKELIKLNASIVSFEIDKELKEKLNLIKADNLQIIYEDFLQEDISNLLKGKNYKHLYFIANIPYYITTPIINKIYKYDSEEIILMIQKEAANRFMASINSREYNSINVLLKYWCDITKIIDVPATSFFPRPNVDSCIIKLKKRNNKEEIINYEHFEKLVKESFRFKRKNLKNNLKSYDLIKVEEILKQFNKNLTFRAENIKVSEFVKISNYLNK